jgi:VanZ family protein
MSGQGLYRSERLDSGVRYAHVKQGDAVEFDILEAQYRAEGYKPDFDELLSKEEYESATPRTEGLETVRTRAKEFCARSAEVSARSEVFPFKPTGWRTVFRILAIAAIVAIVVLSWLPARMEARTGAPGQTEHIAAYAVAAWLAAISLSARRVRWLGLFYIALAGILELGQLCIPGRTSQVIDFAASSAGAILGIWFATLLRFKILPPFVSDRAKSMGLLSGV